MTRFTISQFRAAMRNGAYAWPGGYPLYFVLEDGEALSFEAARKNRRCILEALADTSTHDGWRIVAVDTNWEDGSLFCCDSGARIESAYAEPERDTVTGTAPSSWASYLINGDASGIDTTERKQADAFAEWLGGSIVSCDDAGFMWTHDAMRVCGTLAADCQTYTALLKA